MLVSEQWSVSGVENRAGKKLMRTECIGQWVTKNQVECEHSEKSLERQRCIKNKSHKRRKRSVELKFYNKSSAHILW